MRLVYNKAMKIAAIGDLHVMEPWSDSYAPLFSEISKRADILLLCGDLTNLGLPQEARNLAQDLSALSIPSLAILGNHDLHSGMQDEIAGILSDAGLMFLGEGTRTIGDIGFAGVRGASGGFGQNMLGAFGEQAVKDLVAEALNEEMRLENALQGLHTEKKIVILHYAPIPDTLEGEPLELYPFLGCGRLGEVIDRFDINAVFHGHSHFGTYEGKTAKGISVYNCARDVLKTEGMSYSLVSI